MSATFIIVIVGLTALLIALGTAFFLIPVGERIAGEALSLGGAPFTLAFTTKGDGLHVLKVDLTWCGPDEDIPPVEIEIEVREVADDYRRAPRVLHRSTARTSPYSSYRSIQADGVRRVWQTHHVWTLAAVAQGTPVEIEARVVGRGHGDYEAADLFVTTR